MSVYHHFPNKQHLFDAMVEHAIAGVREPPAEVDPIDRLRFLGREYRAMAYRHPRSSTSSRCTASTCRRASPSSSACCGTSTRPCPTIGWSAQAFRIFGYYVIGAALDETSGYAAGPSAAAPVTEEYIARECPRLAAAAPFFKRPISIDIRPRIRDHAEGHCRSSASSCSPRRTPRNGPRNPVRSEAVKPSGPCSSVTSARVSRSLGSILGIFVCGVGGRRPPQAAGDGAGAGRRARRARRGGDRDGRRDRAVGGRRRRCCGRGASCVDGQRARHRRHRRPADRRLRRARRRSRPSPRAIPGSTSRPAYEVLREIEARRVAAGWRPVGRKIGFTNRTIWPRYGVYLPMWAHVWAHTVHDASANRATLALAPFVQPRIEPEVVFRLHAPVPVTDDARAVLACVEWIAPGFEIVQSHSPDWKFAAADCTAAFGLHGALVVGTPLPVTDRNRAALAAALPTFTLTLRRAARSIDTGVGANVLDSPALALVHLARRAGQQPQFPPLAAGEIVTTGTRHRRVAGRAGRNLDVGLRRAGARRRHAGVRLRLRPAPAREFFHDAVPPPLLRVRRGLPAVVPVPTINAVISPELTRELTLMPASLGLLTSALLRRFRRAADSRGHAARPLRAASGRARPARARRHRARCCSRPPTT